MMVDVPEPWLNLGGQVLFEEYSKTGHGMTKARRDAGLVLRPVFNAIREQLEQLPVEFNEYEETMVHLNSVIKIIDSRGW